jgi:hypothetical protein
VIDRRPVLPVAAAVIAALVVTAGADLAVLAEASAPRASGLAAGAAAGPTIAPAGAPAPADLVLPRPSAPANTPASGAEPRHGLPPDSVAIPLQRVVAPVDLCAMSDGALEPPADVARTCHWAGGAGLGDGRGTVAITGHVNWVGQGTGALGRIGELHIGDAILTSDPTGAVTRWRVTAVAFRSKHRGVDLDAFAGRAGPRTLYLISCGGPFDDAEASYLDNIYVRATPVDSA